MKYPYELSEQRLSLLSRQERNLYKYEHSEYFDYAEKQQAINEFHQAFNDRLNAYYNDLSESYKSNNIDIEESQLNEIAREEAILEAECIFAMIDSIMKPILEEGGFTQKEYDYMAKSIKAELLSESAINEAGWGTDGPDQTFWAKGLGKYISLGFGAVFAGMAGLFMAGKTKAAINKLQDYMNELVETVDDGINKNRSIFKAIGDKISNVFGKIKGWFRKKDKNKSDHSFASFREIQENYLAGMASKAMVLSKNLGFLSGNIETAISEIEANTLSTGESGMAYFNRNLCYPVSRLVNKQ